MLYITLHSCSCIKLNYLRNLTNNHRRPQASPEVPDRPVGRLAWNVGIFSILGHAGKLMDTHNIRAAAPQVLYWLFGDGGWGLGVV